ncbi:DUF1178 family protein [Sulfurisoma sediminicola]|uniref:DUF1178 family protein n=1 Tax=Sulfurisoma sediminicola TaxID=1381557 RepID=A0A497XE57_9PROT|nr:DUF1178 family protein [Sulfurisoma sediminicola]RLJ64989.1 hypothetical protein DFR35_1645 [Sulfurisoma sediminicola]
MIVLNLICSAGHRFEAWFASAEIFEAQAATRLVACPHCQDTDVSRLPSAPHVRRASPAEASSPDIAAALAQTIAKMSAEAEDVGTRFPEEARRIHYHEAAERSIRGQATIADTLELLEEGIPVLPLPSPGKKATH